MGAGALVRAVAEGEVRRLAVEPERVGLVEDGRIAVRRRQDERDLLARADRAAADLAYRSRAVRAKPWFGV